MARAEPNLQKRSEQVCVISRGCAGICHLLPQSSQWPRLEVAQSAGCSDPRGRRPGCVSPFRQVPGSYPRGQATAQETVTLREEEMSQSSGRVSGPQVAVLEAGQLCLEHKSKQQESEVTIMSSLALDWLPVRFTF